MWLVGPLEGVFGLVLLLWSFKICESVCNYLDWVVLSQVVLVMAIKMAAGQLVARRQAVDVGVEAH